MKTSDLIKLYVKKFHQNVPMELLGTKEEDLKKILQKCIDENKPYVVDDETHRY